MADQQYPPRKTRAESFLGIHFDFHAGKDCNEVGARVTREMVEEIIDRVQPDYLQCDCKGHGGVASFQTKTGTPAPGFVCDQLHIWREVTAERGVGLFMHYSGVWDNAALEKHPSWARIDEKGKRDKQKTSVFGPYVDKLLIPQLEELSDVYGVDGVWVDGECWAVMPDYSKAALKAFHETTGITTVPRKLDDPGFKAFMDFNREAFRQYLRHYVDTVHQHNPNFQIASNWAFSSFMPEPVSVNVDFLSGDYPLQDSVNAARLEARCLANQGKPWDLMAWAFSGKWGQGVWSTKSVVQLCQEAAMVLAQGGGFQAYFTQRRDASVRLWQMELMEEAAKFCRARQAFCHRATAVPQIGLLNSTTNFYHLKKLNLFAPWDGELVPLGGILNSLLDAQQAVEIVSEHHLAGRMQEYPLLVLPETEVLEPAFRQSLLDYVSTGGKLLCIGPKAAALFATELGVTLEGEQAEATRWLAHGGWLGGVKTQVQTAVLGNNARPFGTLHTDNDPESPAQPAAAIAGYGSGQIAAVFCNLGAAYRTNRLTVARDFLAALVGELFPRPVVEVTGSHYVDVNVMRQGGVLSVNLVNTAGPHHDGNVIVYDEVPPIGPLTVTIRTETQPTTITRQPAGEAMPFTYTNGEATLTLPLLAIHEILVVE